MIPNNIKQYCCEDTTLIENYDVAKNDRNNFYEVHHRLETHERDGKPLNTLVSREQLIKDGLYYNRPASELILLKVYEHRHIHMLNNQHAKGKNLGNQYAKGNVLSPDVRERMGESRKGNTSNGYTEIRCLETNEIHRTREWMKLGYRNAYQVAYGRQKTCKGLHFTIESITTD